MLLELKKKMLVMSEKKQTLCGSDGEESACSAGDLDWILESGRSPGEGNDNPLHYSCPENPMDRGDWLATTWGHKESETQLSN